MEVREKTVVRRCTLAFAPARLRRLVQARFYKYEPGGGKQKIFAPGKLSRAAVAIRGNRPWESRRGGEHSCHVRSVESATNRSLHRQLVPVVGRKPSFRQQASTPAGKSEYQSIIFTRKDSGIARLEDLKGKVIAFEEPFSSSGYFLPKLDLLKKGFRLAPKRQGSEPVKADEVGYIFSHGDTNTLFWVLNGMVAAGAVDDQKYFMFARNRDSFRIVHESASFPRQLVSFRADFPTKLLARVKELLLDMHQSEEGEKALRDFESTTKFDEIPVQVIDRMEGLKTYIDAELKLQR